MNLIPEPAGGGRRQIRRIYFFAGALVIAAMAFAVVSLAGTVGTNSGFEDDDANLQASTSANVDWNSFAPVTWTGTSPKRQTTGSNMGWNMSGFEDYQATTSDDGFAGGTKQDDDCATVKGTKAPNKDDLKRVYIANKTVKVGGNDHVFLDLAFVRIPLNSTQSSTHVGFEFNEKRAPSAANAGCGGTSPLVHRTPQAWGPTGSGSDSSNPGDLLIVYDYEGSTTSPTLSLRHWIDSGSTIGQSCEISADSPPCWSTATQLPAGVAEAQVNFGATVNGVTVPGAGIIDKLSPTSATNGASHDETLGLKEFGEAGIDLTAAGVFGSSTCIGFGQSEAVSRSSGNSGQAQMEDLVSGPVSINNCGTITIIKHTNPRGLNQAFSYTSNLNPNANAGGVSGVAANGNFSLNDSGNSTGDSAANTVSETDLHAGTYTVTEGNDPSGFAFNSVSCDSDHATTSGKVATINLVANDNITCTYVNDQQLGAIRLKKVSTKSATQTLAGAHFRICTNGTDGGAFSSCTAAKTGSDDLGPTGSAGTVCLDNLGFGDYYVSEKTAPDGYSRDDLTVHKVTVDNNAKCSDTTYVGEALSFSDTPLTDLLLRITSEASGGTKSAAKCVQGTTGPNVGNSPSPSGANIGNTSTYGDPVELRADPANGGALRPGTYTCTVDIDP